VDTEVLGPQGSGRKDVHVPRTRSPYSPEFRREAVALVRSGVPLKQVAAELGVSEQTLRNWRRQGDVDAGRAEGLSAAGYRAATTEDAGLGVARDLYLVKRVLLTPGDAPASLLARLEADRPA
jgi:transposase-like protein